MNKYMVVISHNFDTETRVISLGSEEMARNYLRWVWEEYYNEEIANGSRLVEQACWYEDDEQACWYEDDDVLITWEDGCYTKFELVVAYTPESDFVKKYHDAGSELDERVILSVGPEEIDYAIEAQGLSAFFEANPKARKDALDCAYQRLTSYVDHNDFLMDMVMEAVEDTAEQD